jgi:gentisate 1,2-dioxygenase
MNPPQQRAPAATVGGLMPFEAYLKAAAKPPQSGIHWPWGMVMGRAQGGDHGERGTVALVSQPDSGEAAPGVSLALQVVAPGQATSPHRHSFWHLYVVQEGTGDGYLDGTLHCALAPGDVLYVPAWSLHSFRNTSKALPLVLYALQNLPQVATLGTLVRQSGEEQPERVYQAQPPRGERPPNLHAWTRGRHAEPRPHSAADHPRANGGDPSPE